MNLTVFNDGATHIHNGELWNPSFKEFSEQECQVVQEKKKAKMVFHGKLEDNSRASPMKVIERDGIVLDFDHVEVDITKRIEEALEGYEYTLTNTHSHDPDNNDHCYRGVIATTESIKKDYKFVYWNLVLDNPKLKAMHDEGMLDVRGEDEARCFFAQSIPPERKDKAFKLVRGGTAYKPIYRKREKPNSVSSNDKSVKIMADYFKDEIVLGGTGQRNGFEAREIGRLIKEHGNKEIVLRKALIINETRISPPEPTQEIVRQVNNLWDKHLKENPNFVPTQKKLSRFNLVTKADYEKQGDMEWLVDGLIVRKTINMIVGKSGDTKSFLALHMGLGLAHKRDFFQLDSDIDDEIPVLFNALEGAYGLKNRIDGWCKYFDKEHPDNFSVLEGNPILNNDDSVDEYIEYLQSINFKDGVLFIDTYNQATPSMNENDAGATGQVMANCQRIIQVTGATIFLIHHSGKSEDSEYRGSSAIMGAMDTMIGVKSTGKDWYEWTIKKIKDGEIGTSYKYQTHQVSLGETAKGKPKNTLIIKEGNITKAKGQRQKLATKQQWVFDLIVKRLEGFPNGDEYNAVKEDVKNMMGDQVEQCKKGNLFDTKVKEFQVKNLLKAEVNYPEKETIIQLKES